MATPFLLRHIGQHDLGLWLMITQVVNFLGLLDLGVVTLLPRETAYIAGARPLGERPDLAPLMARVWRIVWLQVPVVILAAALAWWVLQGEWDAVRVPMLLVVGAFVALFPARVFNAVLQGVQDLAFVGRLQLTVWAVSTAITIGLVLAGAGLYAVVLGWVVTQVAGAAGSAIRAYRLRARSLLRRPAGAGRSGGRGLHVALGLDRCVADRPGVSRGHGHARHRTAARTRGGRALQLHDKARVGAGQSSSPADARGVACAE